MQHINIFTKTRWLVTIILLTTLCIGNALGAENETHSFFDVSSGWGSITTWSGYSSRDVGNVYMTQANANNGEWNYVGLGCSKNSSATAIFGTTSATTYPTKKATIHVAMYRDNNYLSITSAKVYVYSTYSSHAWSNKVDEINIASQYTASSNSDAITIEVTPSSGSTWASGVYFKLELGVSNSHSGKNGKAHRTGIDKFFLTEGASTSCSETPTIGVAQLNGSFSLSSVGVSCASSGAGANCSITKYGWVWSDGTSSTDPVIDGTGVTKHENSGAPSGTGGAFTGTLSGSFTVGHTYYYKAYVTNGKPATAYSTVQSFTPRQITFYKNDGTSTTSTQIVKNGVATNLTENSFTRTGHTFNGWNTQADGKGTDKANQASVTVSGGNLDLYAKWTKNNYTLTWNLNGGTVSVAGTGAAVNATGSPYSSVPYGDAITAPTVVKTGYTQNGWNTTPASTMPASNTTYTAQWTANKYDITYKDQGGGDFTGTQSNAPTQHTYGTATALKIPTKTGYTFGGWFTASDCTSGAVGNTNSASLGATDYTDIIILYAKWTKNNYTLTWNLNGGTVTEAGTGAAVDATGTPNISVPYNDAITAPTVTKYGYTFSSWNNTPASTMPAGNTTYTAQWTAKSFDVTWKVNGNTAEGGSSKVDFNSRVSTLPTAPTPPCGDKFMGWTTDEEFVLGTSPLFTTAAGAPVVSVEGNVTYHAVFADYAD